jgi:hippurate hydrolase
VREQIAEFRDEVATWRQDIHRHPELAFQEHRTSDLVAEKLEHFGVEVHRGLGQTGVVGTLRCGQSDRAIALRADIDALPIHELTDLDYRSVHEDIMHACGHDGHTAMYDFNDGIIELGVTYWCTLAETLLPRSFS